MQITDRTAPSYARLRPMRATRTTGFPVYHELTETLATTTTHPNRTIAHVMATCTGYAYSDAATVAMIMARMGLHDNRCRMIAEYVDVMFISSTAFLIQSDDGRVVILCYRGTPPTSLITWLTDADLNPEKVAITFPDEPGSYGLHGGFYRNVRSTRYEVIAALKRALDGKSVLEGGGAVPNQMEALYIAGHSLGGAMAAIMTLMLTTEPDYAPLLAKLAATYTFGQPMIGSPELAAACDDVPSLHENVLRYVYANDIVTQLPPKVSGPFAHFGQEYQYRANGADAEWRHNKAPRGQLGNPLDILISPLSFVAHQIALTRNLKFGPTIDDHLPQRYIAALTPDGVTSEFGD